jgi:putative alpha-1,2-mannosidase
MTFNGAPYDRNFLRHEDLVRGGSITFELGQQPNRQRGTSPSSAPYSFSKE